MFRHEGIIIKKRDKRSLVFLSTVFVGFFMPLTTVVAGETNYIDEADLFDDIQTIESATRLKQKITDAPVSATIIDQEMIQASGATEIHELLRLVPGYFSYSIWGNQFGVSSHYQPGDFNTRLEVQINGRVVYEPLFTGVDWTSLGVDVADIDYIEVVRGSSATAYGSNAFLGAINIITKDVLSRPKTSLRVTTGNIGRKNLTLNHSGTVKDINYGLSLVYKSNTGFDALDTIKSPRDFSHDDRDSLHLSLQGSYVPNLKNEFQFEVGLGRTKLEIPAGGDLRGYSKRKHRNNYQKIKWIHKVQSSETSLQLSHSYLGLNDDFNVFVSDYLGVDAEQIPIFFPEHQNENIPFGPDNSYSERYDIEFVKKKQIANKFNIVWGAGARENRVKSQFLFGDGKISENRMRLFGNIDWHLNKKLNINIGSLVEKTNQRKAVYSPRVALNFHPSKHHTIRTSIAQGKRIPSVTFQHLDSRLRFLNGDLIDVETIGDKNIKDETLSAYEIAYIAKFPKTNTQLDLKLFKEEMDDFVGLQTRPFSDISNDVRVWSNVVNATTRGLELQLSHKFTKIPDLNMRLAYAYIDTDGTTIKDTTDPQDVREASAVPRHSGTLLLSKKLPQQFDVSSVLQYQSDYQGRDVGIKRVDFRIGKKLKFAHSKAKADFVIQNAFNQYNDFSTRNKFKTRAFLRLELDF